MPGAGADQDLGGTAGIAGRMPVERRRRPVTENKQLPTTEQPLMADMQAEIERLGTEARQRQAQLDQLHGELREGRIRVQRQAALLAQTAATAAAQQAELEDLKSSAGWIIFILARRIERQFPRLGRFSRKLLRLVWRAMKFVRARLRSSKQHATAILRGKAPAELAGNLPASAGGSAAVEAGSLDPSRETVLLIVHDASRTGGPILAYNIARRLGKRRNVVALLLAGGELVDDFRASCATVVGPLTDADLHPAQLHLLVDRLRRSYPIRYVIANSIGACMMLRPLTLARVPVVALVHEFPGYMLLRNEMGPTLEWATTTIFSSKLTAEAVQITHPQLRNCPIHILRQGRPDLPIREGREFDDERDLIRLAMRPKRDDTALVVLAVGTLNLRKGADVFVSTAAALAELHPRRDVRFVWIGSPRPEPTDLIYQSFVEEQIARSGIKHMVSFVGDVTDLDAAYGLADVFFMCSRLDPLPNVAIEAGLRGLPVLCFRNASGVAEVFDEEPATGSLVVPYLDARAAAQRIAALADDATAYRRISDATLHVARSNFDMDAYVSRLDELGHQAAALIDQRRQDYETISVDSSFDLGHGGGPVNGVSTRDEAISLFLARSMVHGIASSTNFNYRRPCPGFHPQIYEHENKGKYDRTSINPLAHFIRSGKPPGPWRHEVITPANGNRGGLASSDLRVALHGHFYYPDLAEDFLRKLGKNSVRCDLLLSTGSEDNAARLAVATKNYDRGTVTIRTVPNRGRDIGPLLTLFAAEIRDRYDVVGHLHGKRSLFLADRTIGETWREFLWQNLLGDRNPMVEIILTRFAADPQLGLVFPDDPHLSGWDDNLALATELARRMGITEPLPPFFDFPLGTMFWARTGAVRPLLDLNLSWDDYPQEPVPADGTVLHAVERLLPFAAAHAGYRYATTFVPGVTW
jgi:glycosyltransferase involved in cell wall biosynthesis